jgi:hypothetical protein
MSLNTSLTVYTRGMLTALSLATAMNGCTSQPASQQTAAQNQENAPAQTTGTAVVVNPGAMPAGHPAVPIGDPAENNNRVGRAPRRLTVDQLKASLLTATGFTWQDSRTVADPTAITGRRTIPNADMLEELSGTLGRADFLNTTAHANDPAVTFAKLSSDAARYACRQSVMFDLTQAQPTNRRILREVDPQMTSMSNGGAVRRNIQYLARRFWGRSLLPASPEVSALQHVFDVASQSPAERMGNTVTRPAGTPADGWRAVCIALATDTQFLSY